MSDKAHALRDLEVRKANAPVHVDQGSLPAGSNMTYYCKSCGHVSCVLPESWVHGYKPYCSPCQAMIDKGWL